jgi:carboxyl-terminal processing protease
VAGALQDRDRALILGRTTFGKGSVQSVFTLAGGHTALKLTTALYYTPSGRSIHKPRTRRDLELEEDGGAPADSARDSLVSKPVFKTRSGRVVYGGGGITPDLQVKADSLPPLALEIERRGLAFRFANRWVNTHPNTTVGRELPAGLWSEFATWLRGERLTFSDADLATQRTPIERAVRRELARRTGGDAAAMRVVLEGDAAFERALEVLNRATRPADVFAGGVGDRSRDPVH